MSRPDFPNPPCIMTSNLISRIVSDQEFYDRDAERAERQQRETEEMREMEECQREEHEYNDKEKH